MGYFYISMELIYTNGCTVTSLSVDGKESVDMNMEDFRKVIHKIVDEIDDFAELQSIFMDFVECNGEIIIYMVLLLILYLLLGLIIIKNLGMNLIWNYLVN